MSPPLGIRRGLLAWPTTTGEAPTTTGVEPTTTDITTTTTTTDITTTTTTTDDPPPDPCESTCGPSIGCEHPDVPESVGEGECERGYHCHDRSKCGCGVTECLLNCDEENAPECGNETVCDPRTGMCTPP